MIDPALKPPMASRLRIPRTIAMAAALLCATAVITAPCLAQSDSASQSKKGSQGLWVANFNFFDEFQGESLKKSGDPRETFGLTFAECCPSFPDLTFDNAGNLWIAFVADQGAGVGELTRNELNASKRRLLLHVVLSYENFPTSLAFDPVGDLWVSSFPNQHLIEYTRNQLTASGGQTPASIINLTGISPFVIRFDSSGDLWIAYQFSVPNNSPALVEYTPAQITEMLTGGSPSPSLTVLAGSGLFRISAFAFDAGGNLWMAVPGTSGGANLMYGGLLEMFQVAGKTGTLSQPDVMITPAAISATNQSMDRPYGLAFDDQGGLWVSSNISSGSDDTGFIVKFARDQLATSGSPVPPIVLIPNRKATNLDYPSPIVFGPIVK